MVHPDAVTDGSPTEILDRFITVDLGLSCDRLDYMQQVLPDLVVARTMYRGGLDLEDKPIASVRDYFYLGWMRLALCRFVFEIHEDRSDEDKQEDERHHYVVMKTAARERPPDVSLYGFPESSHGNNDNNWEAKI